MATPDLLSLSAGDLTVRLWPMLGGAIHDFMRAGRPVMRMPPPDALTSYNVRRQACFPLLPYSNRIDHGRFTWRGFPYQLDLNFPGDPHTIHGVGWQQRWVVTHSTDTEARLCLSYDPRAAGLYTWPFSLEAELHYVLDPLGLSTAITLRNTDAMPWPAGLGLHPHFPRTDDLQVCFKADRVWQRDAHSLPTELEAIPAAWDYSAPAPVRPPMMDNCFTGWQGEARLLYPSLGHEVRILAQDLSFLVVYTPDEKPYIALEPVSHMPDAINRGVEARGLHVLAPGESMMRRIRFAVDTI